MRTTLDPPAPGSGRMNSAGWIEASSTDLAVGLGPRGHRARLAKGDVGEEPTLGTQEVAGGGDAGGER